MTKTPPAPAIAGADTDSTGTAAATTGSIACDGDGVTGKRFQAIYARASDKPDRYSTYAASIVQWAAAADKVFVDSAAVTGGVRRMRYVTDSACNLSVLNVTLSPAGDDNIDNTMAELDAKGYRSTNRMYMVWMDANVYCGIAALYLDDRATSSNANNSGPGYARVDNGCWGQTRPIEAHEAMHTIGGIQQSAPHSTYQQNSVDPGTFHCFDENDHMCYPDAPGVVMESVCAEQVKLGLFDCNNDDYFHTSPPAENYLSTHWNPAGSDFLIKTQAAQPPPPSPAPPAGQKYTALGPSRILDTRVGTGGFSAPVGPGKTVNVQVAGQGGVPASGASAVVLNTTVTGPTTGGYLSVFPAGTALPLVSNLNFSAGQTIPNLVVAKVGTNGQVSVYNNSGSTHVIFDVQGYYSPSSTEAYTALGPSRILDTRVGTGGFSAPVGPGKTINVQVAGQGGVPASGASAVVLNTTVTGPTTGGYLSVFPAGTALPLVSNLNFSAGQTIPNLVVAKVGTNGQVSVYNNSGSTHVIFDVQGYYSASTQNPPAVASAAEMDEENEGADKAGLAGRTALPKGDINQPQAAPTDTPAMGEPTNDTLVQSIASELPLVLPAAGVPVNLGLIPRLLPKI